MWFIIPVNNYSINNLVHLISKSIFCICEIKTFNKDCNYIFSLFLAVDFPLRGG